MSNAPNSLDRLESDVLARMARHREARSSAGTLPTGLALAALALSVGMLIGWNESQRVTTSRGSESIVLADDARLAPSELLASAR
jgi:hypothetical protein